MLNGSHLSKGSLGFGSFSLCRIAHLAFAAALAIGFGASIVACSTTEKPSNGLYGTVTGNKPEAPTETGFLGDYSKLQPGGKDQASRVYINPDVNWSQYSSVMLQPVSFWDDPESSIPPADQQDLCNYAYQANEKALSQNFTIVQSPGPGVMKIQLALTKADAATPGLRSVSMVIPQARALSTIGKVATGNYAFVGGARGELLVTDSTTGQWLIAAVDERVGGGSVKQAAQWKWGDAEAVLDFWANLLDKRLMQLRSTGHIDTASN